MSRVVKERIDKRVKVQGTAERKNSFKVLVQERGEHMLYMARNNTHPKYNALPATIVPTT